MKASAEYGILSAFFTPGRLAQLVRALPSHGRGHWSESSSAHPSKRRFPCKSFTTGKVFLLKRRAANKPDSVHTPCGVLRSFLYAINPESHGILDGANRAGRPFDPLFDLAPRRVCPARGVSAAPVSSYLTFSPLRSSLGRSFRSGLRPYSLAPALGISSSLRELFAVYFLWHFPSRTIAVRPPPLTSGSSALRSPDFPLPYGSDRSLARRFRRNCQISRYRMRPHIVQATRPALWSTS